LKEKIDLHEYQGEDRVISSVEFSTLLKESKGNFIQLKSLIPALDSAIEDFRDGS